MADIADIALMMTEEFEKTVERGDPPNNNAGGGTGSEARNFAAVEKVWSSWVESASAAASGVRVDFAVRLEPKTGLGHAAFDGIFSA